MNFSFKSLLAAVLLLCSTVATAHDFEVGGIFYNITSGTEKTVEVTYKGDSYSAYSNEYTGDVTVPSTIAYNGETYSVTSIGYMAFYNCFYLVSIEIPGSVTSIGNSAFSYCFGLTSIEIPGSVTSIGDEAFYNCSGLTSIIVDGNNRHYDSRKGCNAIIETASNTLITGCKNTVIPGSVTSIGRSAFCGCSGLTSIEIPGSVTSIGDEAFYNCSGLTSVTIGDGVTSIGDWAFYDCDGLTSMTIGDGVTSIGDGVFSGCDGLTSIVVDDNNRNYDSREGCNAIIETASNTLITGCKNTVIPGSVTSIGEYAFSCCDGLTSIEIPGSVTSIGDGAFFYCSGLTSVTSLATTAPGLGSYAFYGISSDATLYYPAGSDYSSWARYFANIEEITEEFPEEEEVFGDLNSDGTVSVSDI